jgi:two-component system, response regulator YesN
MIPEAMKMKQEVNRICTLLWLTDGMELLVEARKRNLATCVVFLSEHSEFAFAKEAIKHGIFDYLVKPVKYGDLRPLLEKVRTHVDEKRAEELRVRALEEKLIEKISVYYPSEMVGSTARLISDGDMKALQVISAMVKEINVSMDSDSTKSSIVLQRAFSEILASVRKKHGWLDDFVDMDAYSAIILDSNEGTGDMGDRIMSAAAELLDMLARFLKGGGRHHYVGAVCDYVIRNVESEIRMEDISSELFVSKNYVGDVFRHETGMTVGEYVTMAKMERAKRLLSSTILKGYEVAERLGYGNVEYFAKVFKKYAGMSPMEFRNEARGGHKL